MVIRNYGAPMMMPHAALAASPARASAPVAASASTAMPASASAVLAQAHQVATAAAQAQAGATQAQINALAAGQKQIEADLAQIKQMLAALAQRGSTVQATAQAPRPTLAPRMLAPAAQTAAGSSASIKRQTTFVPRPVQSDGGATMSQSTRDLLTSITEEDAGHEVY